MKYLSSKIKQIESDKQQASSAAHVDATHQQDGANAPRTVIRGESFIESPLTNMPDIQPRAEAHPYSAHTDWLNCTFPVKNESEFLSNFAQLIFEYAGMKFASMEETGKGLHGWKRSFNLGKTGCKLAIGGQNDTAFLSFTGFACGMISLEAWPLLAILFKNHLNGKITRWDGAADDHVGKHSVDWAVEQYFANQFNSGGNRPSCNQHGNWLMPDGRGRTFEIGKRQNGKMLRIYEKGKQLGDPSSLWVRWEVELHNKDREIPWDILVNPGKYIAGAYPCTQWVQEEASRIKTIQTTQKIGYNKLIHHAKLGYGKLINTMLEIEGSPEKVIELLSRSGIPTRLQLPEPPELDD